jgi:PTH1 family peptidyl-tRNA hydrolase
LPGRIRIVVGLGNPGTRYAQTRHNVGFRLLDRLRADLDAGPESGDRAIRVSWAEVDGEPVALVRPLLYMNRSGEALARLPESETAGPEGHLVLLDDVWLPFGALRFRRGGSAGGHRGLASILSRFGSEAVPRLRLGIGGESEEDLVDHVLAGFTAEERNGLDGWLERASEGVRVCLREGIEAAMNRYNG